MPNTESLWQGLANELARYSGLWRGAWVRAWLVCGALCSVSPAQDGRPAPWKTGAELERQLESLVGVEWSANPLRQALSNLSRHQQVAVFLDRRIDPDQELKFSMADAPLRRLLASLAEHLGAGACRVGPVYYIGPKRTATLLSTLAAAREGQLKNVSAAGRSRLARAKPLRWAELSTPREILKQLAAESELSLEGLEQIPHDLWPAVDLPPLTLAQRLSLILAGFELTFELAEDGQTARLVPLPVDAVLERIYPVTASHNAALQEISRRFPEARLTRQGGTVTLAGPAEAHEALQKLLQPQRPSGKPPRSPAGKGEVLWSLKIANKPVGAVVQTLAKRLGGELEYAPELRSRLEQLVSFDVQDVSLDELLQTALTPAKLTYRLEGKKLVILPTDPSP